MAKTVSKVNESSSVDLDIVKVRASQQKWSSDAESVNTQFTRALDAKESLVYEHLENFQILYISRITQN